MHTASPHPHPDPVPQPSPTLESPVAGCSHNAHTHVLHSADNNTLSPSSSPVAHNPSDKVAAVVHSVPGAKHVPAAAAQEARVLVDHEGVVWSHAVRPNGQDLDHTRL